MLPGHISDDELLAPLTRDEFQGDPELYIDMLRDVQDILNVGLQDPESKSPFLPGWITRANALGASWAIWDNNPEGQEEKVTSLLLHLNTLLEDIRSEIPAVVLGNWADQVTALERQESWTPDDEPAQAQWQAPQEDQLQEEEEQEAQAQAEKAAEMLVELVADRLGPSPLPVLADAPTQCYDPDAIGIVDIKKVTQEHMIVQMLEGYPHTAYCSSLNEIVTHSLTEPTKIFYRCKKGQIFRDKKIVNMYPLASLYVPFDDLLDAIAKGAQILVFSRTDRTFEETSSESVLEGMAGAAVSGHHCGPQTNKRIYNVAGYLFPEKKETKEKETKQKKAKKKETKQKETKVQLDRNKIQQALALITKLKSPIPAAFLAPNGVWEEMLMKGKKRLNVGLFDLSASDIQAINQVLKPIDAKVIRKSFYSFNTTY